MSGKPIASKDEFCPLWRKTTNKVCHTCKWYQKIYGTNPQTGEVIDKWGCAIEFVPILQIETAQQSRQTGASVDKLTNVVVRARQQAPATPRPYQVSQGNSHAKQIEHGVSGDK